MISRISSVLTRRKRMGKLPFCLSCDVPVLILITFDLPEILGLGLDLTLRRRF
jgi:hypothetical protein